MLQIDGKGWGTRTSKGGEGYRRRKRKKERKPYVHPGMLDLEWGGGRGRDEEEATKERQGSSLKGLGTGGNWGSDMERGGLLWVSGKGGWGGGGGMRGSA